MNKGYIKDHADRKWAIDPTSNEYHVARGRAEAYEKGLVPKVGIGSGLPRIPTMFARKMS